MNVAEKLAREIRRVAMLRCQYEEAGRLSAAVGGLRVMVSPAITMMDMALERACLAAGLNDVLEQMAALRELEGFEQ